MSSRLHIHTLGHVEILLGGRPLAHLGSRTAEALLLYLLHQPRPLPRQVLADFFWDNRSGKQALANLRAVLSLLRAELDDYLLVDRTTVGFNHDSDYWLDTAVFRRRLAAKPQAPSIPDLQEAIELYQGDFLTGYYLSESRGFEEWVLLQREQLHRQAIMGLHRLLEHHAASGQYEAGVQDGQRLLALDPLDEEAMRQMMWLWLRLGQRQAALKQYENGRRLLAAELNEEPAPATTALYQRLRATPFPPPSFIPQPATPLIGRQKEMADLTEHLVKAEARLITIHGPGGIGKTRLALELGHHLAQAHPGRFVDGIYFSSLAAAAEINVFPLTLADCLGFTFQGAASAWEQLVDYLSDREMCLILDDFERHIQAQTLAWLANVLSRAAAIKLLITSRERLGLQGEVIYSLTGLDQQSNGSSKKVSDADRLFLQQASRLQVDFAPDEKEQTAVSQICRLVGGMPLAIELAAAGVRYFSCQQIAADLQGRLDWVYSRSANLPARHQTIQAVLEHTWENLTSKEQAVLPQLAVFSGPFAEEATRQITNINRSQLMIFHDKSLLTQVEPGRFSLHPLMRHFLADKFQQSPQAAGTSARHAAYYTRLILPDEEGVNMEQRYHELSSLLAVHGAEVASAARWAAAQPDFMAHNLDKLIATLNFYYNRSHRYEAWQSLFRQLHETLENNPINSEEKIWLQAVLLSRIALAAIYQHAYQAAEKQLEGILPQAYELENGALISACLNMLGIIALRQGEFDKAWQLAEEAVTAVTDYHPHYKFPVYRFMVEVALAANWLDKAEAANETAYQLALAVKSEAEAASVYVLNKGMIAHRRGQLTAARELLTQALALAQNKKETAEIATCLIQLGRLSLTLKQWAQADSYLDEAEKQSQAIKDSRLIALVTLSRGQAAEAQQDAATAVVLYEQSLKLFEAIQSLPDLTIAREHLQRIQKDSLTAKN